MLTGRGVFFYLKECLIMSKIKEGDYVEYILTKELGRVKRIEGNHVWVVFRCEDNWQRYMEYTAQLCTVDQLRKIEV
jgi:hypothetical protein